MLKTTAGFHKSPIVLKDCSSLRNLIIATVELPSNQCIYTPSSSSLTRVTLHGRSPWGGFCLPFFRTITHLHLPHDTPDRDPHFTPTNLPDLTHIVCTLYTYNINHHDVRRGLREFGKNLRKFMKLRLIAVHVVSSHNGSDLGTSVESLLSEFGSGGLPPLLIKPAEQWSQDHSEHWINGGESVWEQAERELLEQGRYVPYKLAFQACLTTTVLLQVVRNKACISLELLCEIEDLSWKDTPIFYKLTRSADAPPFLAGHGI